MTTPEQSPPKRRRIAGWPAGLIMMPAAVAIWAGWVGLGQLTGFGVVQLFPGVPVLERFQLNTSITLPVGMEAYAAYALRVWLAPGISTKLRDYARASSIGSMILGLVGQIAFHLMSAAGVQQAHWSLTMFVSCLPIGVAMMAAGLLHLIREENETIDRENRTSRPATVAAVAEPIRPATPEPTVRNPLAGRAPVRPQWAPAVSTPEPPIAPEPPPEHPPAPIRIPGPDHTPAPPQPQHPVIRPRPTPPPAEALVSKPKVKPQQPKPELNPVGLAALQELTDSTLSALSVDQLRKLARNAGLTQRGTRAQVLERLSEHVNRNGRAPVGGGMKQ